MACPYAVPITLSTEERNVLLGWARRPKTAQALALRARIVLAASEQERTTPGLPKSWESRR